MGEGRGSALGPALWVLSEHSTPRGTEHIGAAGRVGRTAGARPACMWELRGAWGPACLQLCALSSLWAAAISAAVWTLQAPGSDVVLVLTAALNNTPTLCGGPAGTRLLSATSQDSRLLGMLDRGSRDSLFSSRLPPCRHPERLQRDQTLC